MNRTLGVERVYSLGDYKTLRVSDQITDIPEDLALNDDFVSAVRKLQLVSIELVCQKYLSLARDVDKFHATEKESALIEIKANVMDELLQIINTKKE